MITIRAPRTKDEFKAYYALRYRVMREPTGQPHGTEKDDYEPISQHLMAVDKANGEVCGVVKWLEREPGLAWLTHLAVAPARQKQGIGRQLVEAVEAAARAGGYTRIVLHCRLDESDYFLKLGYAVLDLAAFRISPVHAVWLGKALVSGVDLHAQQPPV